MRIHQRRQYLLLEPLVLLDPRLVERIKARKRTLLRQQRRGAPGSPPSSPGISEPAGR
jgi:hypothetical protein